MLAVDVLLDPRGALFLFFERVVMCLHDLVHKHYDPHLFIVLLHHNGCQSRP